MDNVFIKDLYNYRIKNSKLSSFWKKLAHKFITFFNSNNKFFELRFKKKEMISIEQGINIYHLLSQTLKLKIPGDIVELGCHEGITSILIQKTLDQFNSKKTLHVYDSFQGLPEKSKKDQNKKTKNFQSGKFSSSENILIENFNKNNTKIPKIHKGWFKDTLSKELPKKISFAHIDGDFYNSILQSLKHIYPKLSKGAIVIIDDYCDPKINNVHNVLPGVKKACDEFFKNKKEKINVLIAGDQSHGYFKKK